MAYHAAAVILCRLHERNKPADLITPKLKKYETWAPCWVTEGTKESACQLPFSNPIKGGRLLSAMWPTEGLQIIDPSAQSQT